MDNLGVSSCGPRTEFLEVRSQSVVDVAASLLVAVSVAALIGVSFMLGWVARGDRVIVSTPPTTTTTMVVATTTTTTVP